MATNESKHGELLSKLDRLIVEFSLFKPLDRSEMARRYAVTITELEKAHAYFNTYVVVASKSGEPE